LPSGIRILIFVNLWELNSPKKSNYSEIASGINMRTELLPPEVGTAFAKSK